MLADQEKNAISKAQNASDYVLNLQPRDEYFFFLGRHKDFPCHSRSITYKHGYPLSLFS